MPGKARSWYSPTSLLPLRIEKTDNARPSAAVAYALKTYRLGCHLQGVTLRLEKGFIMLEGSQ